MVKVKTIKSTPSAERSYTNVALTKKLHKRLTKYATLHRMQVGGVVDRAVEAYLDNVGAA